MATQADIDRANAAYARKMKKMAAKKAKYPVVRKFTIDTGTSSGDVYVDIGQSLSLMNHRLYRQGRMYRVRVSVTQPIYTGIHAITTLPDTWWARRAYNKVREIWMMRIADIKKAQGKHGIGRWNDFKVGYDNAHHDAFTSAKVALMVTDATGTQAAMTSSNEEWNLSELLDNDGNDNTFRMLGATSGTEFGVISSYSNVTNVFAPDPDETSTGAQAYGDFSLDGGGDQTDMDDQGDFPPYHETAFPQLEVLQGQLTCTADMAGPTNGQGIQRLSTGYFDCPLGLLRITSGADVELTIEVQEGDYKGVNAPEWK